MVGFGVACGAGASGTGYPVTRLTQYFQRDRHASHGSEARARSRGCDVRPIPRRGAENGRESAERNMPTDILNRIILCNTYLACVKDGSNDHIPYEFNFSFVLIRTQKQYSGTE